MAFFRYVLAFVREAILGKLTVAEAFRYAPKRAITFVVFVLLLMFSVSTAYKAPDVIRKLRRMEVAEARVVELVAETSDLHRMIIDLQKSNRLLEDRLRTCSNPAVTKPPDKPSEHAIPSDTDQYFQMLDELNGVNAELQVRSSVGYILGQALLHIL